MSVATRSDCRFDSMLLDSQMVKKMLTLFARDCYSEATPLFADFCSGHGVALISFARLSSLRIRSMDTALLSATNIPRFAVFNFDVVVRLKQIASMLVAILSG